MSRQRIGRDAVVIGAGDAGGALARELARSGFETVLIDDGAAANDGERARMPWRNLAASAKVARLARRAVDFGVATGNVAVDLGKALARNADPPERGMSSREPARPDGHLSLLKGPAQFASADTLLVGERDHAVELKAAKFFINSGTREAIPEVPGVAEVGCLTPEAVADLDELPAHLLVLGGSYTAVEIGQLFRRLGSRVSILERRAQLLAHEDRDVAAAVAEILREDGIDIFLETEMLSVSRAGPGVSARVRTPSGEHSMTASRMLVVPGREPNTGGLGLRAAGVAVDHSGYVDVNERLETSVPGIYAMGSVTGGPAFPNLAFDDLRILRSNVIARAGKSMAGRMSPYAVFDEPRLARIGLSETRARKQGRSVRVAKLPMKRVARAYDLDDARGLLKVVVDADAQRVLGAAVLGIDSGEIMAMFQIAMIANMPYASLRDCATAHPTLAGTFEKLFSALDD